MAISENSSGDGGPVTPAELVPSAEVAIEIVSITEHERSFQELGFLYNPVILYS